MRASVKGRIRAFMTIDALVLAPFALRTIAVVSHPYGATWSQRAWLAAPYVLLGIVGGFNAPLVVLRGRDTRAVRVDQGCDDVDIARESRRIRRMWLVSGVLHVAAVVSSAVGVTVVTTGFWFVGQNLEWGAAAFFAAGVAWALGVIITAMTSSDGIALNRMTRQPATRMRQM